MKSRKNPVAAAGAVVSACVLAATMGVTGAAPAVALTGNEGGYSVNGVAIRTGPHTTNTVKGRGYTNQRSCLAYYTTGTTVHGDNHWWYNLDMATGVVGYSAEYYLWTYAPAVGCASV